MVNKQGDVGGRVGESKGWSIGRDYVPGALYIASHRLI